MSIRIKFIDLQRYVYKSKEFPEFILDYSERRRYSEKLMYYYMGIKIASLDKNRMPFFKMKNSITYVARSSDLGKEILSLLEFAGNSNLFGLDEEYARALQLSPIMRMTYNAFAAAASGGAEVKGVGFVKPVISSERYFRSSCGKHADSVVDGLNNFVLQFNMALKKKSLREEVKSFYRNAKERYFQLMKVASQAWDLKCKNVLIRVDWGFLKENPPLPPRLKTEAEINQDFSIVEARRKLMQKRLKKMFGNDLSFYAWKIECGFDKGLHIHWLLALNGSKFKNAWFHTQAIVDDWDKNICGSDSYAWNVLDICKGKGSGQYLRNLDYRDKDLPKILDTYARYLTKLDVTMKLRAPEGFRTFGCSKLKNLNTKKPGPKRFFQEN